MLIAKQSLTADIDSSNRYILLTRCLSGSICFLCFVNAIKYIPLSIYFVVMNAGPFFIALLACLWLKERITLFEVCAMVGAFSGIVMVGFSKNIQDQQEASDDDDIASKLYQVGFFLAIVCVVTHALTLVTTRRLRSLSVIQIQWYYALCSCLFTGFSVWFLQEKSFALAFT